ncbi:MAG: DUF1330 domain-containing protein [Rhodobacteraceae bacterium]|nr:DUF1330 domain-containing protein [Paracoccaceae bacterium]MCY4195383.1 DUF1330 domain-containing protein [Paracoccaceae bacterium]MCY4327032.1 DUF1330 domain-containing protein [Paracoccaceae bacterium]
MKAYWIAHVEVTDSETYGKYAQLATQAIEEHGGKFLARGGRYELLEGSVKPRNVVAEFPSMEDALACYHSESYAKALNFSRRSSQRDVMILEGI